MFRRSLTSGWSVPDALPGSGCAGQVTATYFVAAQVGVAITSSVGILASTPIAPAEQAVAPYMTAGVALGALAIW